MCFYDKPLFLSDFVRWRHGPVVEDIWIKWKRDTGFYAVTQVEISQDTKMFIDYICMKFPHSATVLERMTHSELPWQTTPADEVITKEKIAAYFKGRSDIYGEDAIRIAGTKLGFDDALIVDHINAAKEEQYNLFEYAQVMEKSWHEISNVI